MSKILAAKYGSASCKPGIGRASSDSATNKLEAGGMRDRSGQADDGGLEKGYASWHSSVGDSTINRWASYPIQLCENKPQ